MHTEFATLSAAALLAIPEDRPERLFKGGADDIKKAHRLLTMKWHPDRNGDPGALPVFQHVQRLFEEAQRKIALGEWPGAGTIQLSDLGGKTYEIGYLRQHRFELGTMYVSPASITFAIDREHADLVEQAERTIRSFNYGTDKMRTQISPHLPAMPFVAALRTADAYVIVMRKAPGFLLLRDVLDHVDGRLDPRHVAWVLSSLLNLCCYFQYAGITHNALSLETCFMAPADHGVAVLGGWWYAARTGERMLAAPARTLAWGPHDLLATKVAGIRTDLELVRAIGRELLGDVSGSRLARDGAAPQAMIDWLRLPASSDSIEEYRTWRDQVLHDSFGARRFAELPLTQSDLYQTPR